MKTVRSSVLVFLKLATFVGYCMYPRITKRMSPGLMFFNGLCMETGNDLNMVCGREYWDKLMMTNKF